MAYKTRRREWRVCRRETVDWRKRHCGTCAPKRAGFSVLYNASRPKIRVRRLFMDRRSSLLAGRIVYTPETIRSNSRRRISKTGKREMEKKICFTTKVAAYRAFGAAVHAYLRRVSARLRWKLSWETHAACNKWTDSVQLQGVGRGKCALAGPVRRVWASSGRPLPWSESDTWAVRTPAGYR